MFKKKKSPIVLYFNYCEIASESFGNFTTKLKYLISVSMQNANDLRKIFVHNIIFFIAKPYSFVLTPFSLLYTVYHRRIFFVNKGNCCADNQQVG